jgi:chitinase
MAKFHMVTLAGLLVLTAAGCHQDLLDDPAGELDAGAPDDPAPDAAPGLTARTWSVYLRTEVSGQYLSARNAGGGEVTAAGAAQREWENFQLVDENGGQLRDGDEVHLRTYDGRHYLQAGDGTVNAAATSASEAASFHIVRVGGGDTIAIGDTVALRSKSQQTFVSAQNGGGGEVTATSAENGAWEHFVLLGHSPDGDPPPPPTDGKRVIGYLPNWYGSYRNWATRIDFSRLTQVNLAFALGDDQGNLQLAPGDEIDAFVSAAHAHGVKVFPSLCGGGGDGRIAPHYQPDRVDDFVERIIGFVQAHHLDGIDVDVEAPNRMGASYDAFIAKLKARAAPLGLPVSAAVAEWVQSGMSNETLRSFDFITVMVYDNAGTWTGPGEHASYQQALDALAFYQARGVARDHIVLGVPFYGYCWGNCNGRSSAYVLYKDILARFPDAWNADWIERDGARYSYNGISTMSAKAQLGHQYGGIMIWELAGDVSSGDEHSLLRAIKP